MESSGTSLIYQECDSNKARRSDAVENLSNHSPPCPHIGPYVDVPLQATLLQAIGYLLWQVGGVDSLNGEIDLAIAGDIDYQRVFSGRTWHQNGMIHLGPVAGGAMVGLDLDHEYKQQHKHHHCHHAPELKLVEIPKKVRAVYANSSA